MVPLGGLEPPLPKETDFESVMSTNFITVAQQGFPFDEPHYTEEMTLRNSKKNKSNRLLIISPQKRASKLSLALISAHLRVFSAQRQSTDPHPSWQNQTKEKTTIINLNPST